MITGATRVVGVIGDPVRHSLSPAIHNAAFAALGLDWVYAAFPVRAGDGGAAVAAACALGLAGLNVTMPHKADAAAACDRLTDDAAALQSVNTVVVGEDGKALGDSTDGPGFLAALAEDGIAVAGRRVLVIGAGGAAHAVILALGRAGAEVSVAARRLEAAEAAARLAPAARALFCPPDAGSVERNHRIRGFRSTERDGGDAATLAEGLAGFADVVGAVEIIVNATPIGMDGSSVPLDPALLRSDHTVVDLIYHPAETPLLAAARARGARATNGLGMLVHQAARSFSLWTGLDAPVPAMRAAAEEAIARR